MHTSSGRATGPVGFLRVYDQAFGEIAQGGSRRGANMGVLRVDHPDIEEFIECKAEEGKIANFNISVAITDEFMAAVRDDTDFNLRNPRDGKIWRTLRARDLFAKIVKYAHHNGEPGALFIDAANRSNPVPHLYDLEATNPCGEQWLGPYENCCLGSINLAVHVTHDDGGRNRRRLGTAAPHHRREHALPGQRRERQRLCARRARSGRSRLPRPPHRPGHHGPGRPDVRAGHPLWQRRGPGVCRADHGVRALPLHGEEHRAGRGARSLPGLCGQHLRPAAARRHEVAAAGAAHAYARDWEPPAAGLVVDRLRHRATRHPQRRPDHRRAHRHHRHRLGCEGYGCEPVFALGYIRHFKDGDRDVELHYTSPLFEQALDRSDLSEADKSAIKQHVATYGTCQDLDDLPECLRHTFVVSSDITADEHVRMQAAIQAFVDNSISKTCNFPEGATEEDVAKAYMLAWETGCKGLTVYVTGSRQMVVLETKATRGKKDEPGAAAEVVTVHANGDGHAAATGIVNGSNGYHTEARWTPASRERLPPGHGQAAAAQEAAWGDLSQGDAAGHGLHHRQQRRAATSRSRSF